MTRNEISKTLSDLVAAATVGVTVEGQHIQTTNITLTDGNKLYCSHNYRSSNSRGARRGRGTTVEFRFKLATEQFSKRITREAAAEILSRQ